MVDLHCLICVILRWLVCHKISCISYGKLVAFWLQSIRLLNLVIRSLLLFLLSLSNQRLTMLLWLFILLALFRLWIFNIWMFSLRLVWLWLVHLLWTIISLVSDIARNLNIHLSTRIFRLGRRTLVLLLRRDVGFLHILLVLLFREQLARAVLLSSTSLLRGWFVHELRRTFIETMVNILLLVVVNCRNLLRLFLIQKVFFVMHVVVMLDINLISLFNIWRFSSKESSIFIHHCLVSIITPLDRAFLNRFIKSVVALEIASSTIDCQFLRAFIVFVVLRTTLLAV